jgi:hypothetical protein
MTTSGSHLIISGTGRAGTTFLVQYFTALGFDTGFSLEQALSEPDILSNAGLEPDLSSERLPHVIKSPWFADKLGELLGAGRLSVEGAIIPVRDLFSAAESRRRVYREAKALGVDPLAHPGTIWKTTNPEDQEVFLAMQFYKLIEPLVAHNIPIYFLHFPDFAKNHTSLYRRLEIILRREGINQETSEAAFKRVVNISLIHNFHSVELNSSRVFCNNLLVRY